MFVKHNVPIFGSDYRDMSNEDIDENILAEPLNIYQSETKNSEPYFFDPLEDFGFKRLFAAQQNIDLTISFLNLALRGKRQIVSLEVLKNEYPGDTGKEGSSAIDMVCRDQNGDFFLVEMQRQFQKNFKERSLYYGSRLITEQAPRGNRSEWAYDLKDVYVISLLEKFTVGGGSKDMWLHDIALINKGTAEVFSNRLAFTYIELMNFNKSEDQLETVLDQWVYALKNLNRLKQIPLCFNDPLLMEFCQAARYINLTKEEKDMISAKTKQRWDNYSVMISAKYLGHEEGKAEGQAEGKALGETLGKAMGAHENSIKIAIKLKSKGLSSEEIQEITELSIDEIARL